MLAPAVAAHLNEVIKSQDFGSFSQFAGLWLLSPSVEKHFSLNELYEVETINFSLKPSALCTRLDYFSAFLEVRCEDVIECDQWNIDRSVPHSVLTHENLQCGPSYSSFGRF